MNWNTGSAKTHFFSDWRSDFVERRVQMPPADLGRAGHAAGHYLPQGLHAGLPDEGREIGSGVALTPIAAADFLEAHVLW